MRILMVVMLICIGIAIGVIALWISLSRRPRKRTQCFPIDFKTMMENEIAVQNKRVSNAFLQARVSTFVVSSKWSPSHLCDKPTRIGVFNSGFNGLENTIWVPRTNFILIASEHYAQRVMLLKIMTVEYCYDLYRLLWESLVGTTIFHLMKDNYFLLWRDPDDPRQIPMFANRDEPPHDT